MSQIKISGHLLQANDQQLKPRINLKAAVRLAQKEENQLILKILKFHNPNCIQPIQNYEQEKSQLQKFLDCSSEDRNKKLLRAIKAQLSSLKCFQIRQQQENTPKELLSIMKRDLDMLMAVISKFVHSKLWPKGSLIQLVAHERDKVRVLLRGQVAIFEPINYKSYKNCLKLYQADKARDQLISTIFGFSQQVIHYDNQSLTNQYLDKINPQQLNPEDWQEFNNTNKSLSLQTAKNFLKKMNIITVATPHRFSLHLKAEGQLICSQLHPFIVEQQGVYQHTAICLSECYVMQLEYEVYKQAISQLNSDDEKRFIAILLRKFEMMEYFDAKQYVKPQFMIDKMKEEIRDKQKMEEKGTNISDFQKQLMLNQGRDFPKKQDQQQDEQNMNSNKQKEQTDMQSYPIAYDNDLYLIIQGEVTIKIDIIEQTRLSTLQHASKIRQRKPRSILKLYQGDIFGFQEIGKTKQYNLTYFVRKNSKILLMADEIYVRHFSQIEGFRQQLKSLQLKRNQLLSKMIKNLQKTIQQQQLKKYKSISGLQRTRFNKTPSIETVKNQYASFLPSHLVPPRQVQYLGSKQYEKQQRKLRQNIIKQKQVNGGNLNLQKLVKNGTNLRQTLPFVSAYKNTLSKNSSIVGNYIEIRDNKGALLRKRSIVDTGRDQTDQKYNFFRKIGVINGEERNDHNLNIIKNRKSKYQIEQFGQNKKQLKRLKNIATSLPKMKNFYAKKQQVLYNNLHKLDYSKMFN